jgi:hypothetical protein
MALTTYLATVWQVLLELAPSLLAGLFSAGLMHIYLPVGFVHRGLNRPDLRSVVRASLIGVPLPMAGPATNVAAIGAVYRALGGRVLAAYLGTVASMSIALGLAFDGLLPARASERQPHVHGSVPWIGTLATLVLLAALGYLMQRRLRARFSPSATLPADLTLKVDCMKRVLEGIAEVTEANPDLAAGLVCIRGESLDVGGLIQAIEGAGFAASLTKKA